MFNSIHRGKMQRILTAYGISDEHVNTIVIPDACCRILQSSEYNRRIPRCLAWFIKPLLCRLTVLQFEQLLSP